MKIKKTLSLFLIGFAAIIFSGFEFERNEFEFIYSGLEFHFTGIPNIPAILVFYCLKPEHLNHQIVSACRRFVCRNKI